MNASSLVRRWRFWALENLLLPPTMPMLRSLVRSWRCDGPDPAILEQMLAAPRVVLATYHGMLIELLAYCHLPQRSGRRLVVMLSPSHDGRLLGAALAHFGLQHVFATPGSRSVAGTREFIDRVAQGDIGVIAVDGPRGPRCVAKRGFLQIAVAADAHLALVTTAARRGVSMRSWDRASLPAPFTKVCMSLELLPPPDRQNAVQILEVVQEALSIAAERLRGRPGPHGSSMGGTR